MAYVTVPKDLTKVKSKVLFGLTKRQLACFTPAVLIGVPLFFLLKDRIGTSTAAFVMILVMLPFFLLAMYEHNGLTLDIIIRHFIRTKFLLPKQRPYQTNNFYAVLMRQNTLEKEVKTIAKQTKSRTKAKAHPQREAGN